MRLLRLLIVFLLLAACQTNRPITSLIAVQTGAPGAATSTPRPATQAVQAPQDGPATSAARATAVASAPTAVQATATSPVKPSSTVAQATIAPATPAATFPAGDLHSLKGDLWNQVSRLEQSMPLSGSQGFVIPSQAERETFARIVTALENGDISTAGSLAAANHYELLRYMDHGDSDRQSYILRELRTAKRGWGLYALRIGSTSPVIVEAPHPLADEGTPHIATQVYRMLDGRALLVAGAHRNANADDSADVAHNPQNIFQAGHIALVTAIANTGQPPIVLQIHGFAANKHPGYPQVVFGSNLNLPEDSAERTDLLQRLAAAMAAQGLQVGVCDGTHWRDLCGETNMQSKSMTSGIFLHFELDESVRSNSLAFLAALRAVFAAGF